ncbi:hypothetical protein ACEV8Z_24390, partial [Vibrio parahaemolyticus]
ESRADARVHNLADKERKLDELTFKHNGRPGNYVAKLDAKARGMTLAAGANGPFNNGVWQGQLHTVDITGTESLRLKLQHPVALLVSADLVR